MSQVSLHAYAKIVTTRLFDHFALTARSLLVLEPHRYITHTHTHTHKINTNKINTNNPGT